jgi:competence protein ComEC
MSPQRLVLRDEGQVGTAAMDYIQKKLALIDAQRTGQGRPLRLVIAAPLFFPALGLIAGILLQDGLAKWRGDADDVLLWVWAGALDLCTAVILIRLALDPDRIRLRWPAGGAAVCFLCLGAIRLLTFQAAAGSDIRNLIGQERRLATVRGRIVTQPYQQRQDWCFARFANADPSTAFYLRAEQIKTPTGWREVSGAIRVRVDEPAPNLRIGDFVQLDCWLDRFDGPTNPGEFDLAAYLARRNVYVGASVPSRDAVELQGSARAGLLTSLRRQLTESATQGLMDYIPSDAQDQAMLQALLLGNRRDIDADTYEAFRKTGLAHIISLSGMHAAILIGVIWCFCKLAGLGRRARALVCMAATVAFLLVVPPRAPILRAAVVVWVYCLAVFLRRRVNPLNSLSLAAIALLLLWPTQLFEAGWQLSFGAVAGILAFAVRIEHFIHERAGGWLLQADRLGGPMTRWTASLARYAVRLFAAGTAAWLGSAGILLYHFRTITPLAGLWTVMISLPVAAIVTLGFLKILVSSLLPTLSLILGLVLSALADVLIWAVRLAARIDFSSTLIGHVPLVLVLLFYALILWAGFVHLRRRHAKNALSVTMAVVLLASLGVVKWQRTHRDHLILTCLDVGHGQAILAQLPGTANLLFDAGSTSTTDVGTRIVLPCLDYLGVSRLHAVVLSHQDIDHVNGVPEVVDRVRVDRVYANDTLLAEAQTGETTRVLLQHLQATGVEVERVPETLVRGPAQVRILWPVLRSPPGQPLSDNDRSLVCMIEFAGARLLLCSDIEKLAQRQVIGLYPDLKAGVVVVPHHGSVKTLDPGFLEQLGAGVLLCSCGKLDFERGRVIRQSDSRRLYVTACHGAIIVCVGGDGVIQVSHYENHE